MWNRIKTYRAFALTLSIMFCTQIGSVSAESLNVRSDTTRLNASAISGYWQFETGSYFDGLCRMSGQMSVFASRASDARELDCELVAIEDCAGLISKVEQVCTLSVEDSDVQITSDIVNVLQSKPGSIGYAPDNFDLTVKSDSLMEGQLVSAARAKVRFYRSAGGIS